MDALCRICGGISPAERQAITKVADEFFPVNGDGTRHNHRADQELHGYVTQADTNRRIAAEREVKRKEREALNGSLNDSLPVGSTNDQPKLEVRSQKLEVINQSSKTLSGKPDVHKQTAIEILNFLNAKTGRHYKPVKVNLGFIIARLKAGATETELRQVVAKKTREWQGNPVMDEYLRPATLFNDLKFNQYVGELLQEGDQNAMS